MNKRWYCLIGLIIIMSILLVACDTEETQPACEHEWVNATCTEPQHCSKCGATMGSALGHDWVSATATSDGYCKRCREKGSKSYLSGGEITIYNAITMSLSNFKDPSSVRLISVKEGYEGPSDSQRGPYYFLTISATNSFGGTVQEVYTVKKDVSYQRLSNGDSAWESVASTAYEIRVSSINSCLSSYCKSNGWD